MPDSWTFGGGMGVDYYTDYIVTNVAASGEPMEPVRELLNQNQPYTKFWIYTSTSIAFAYSIYLLYGSFAFETQRPRHRCGFFSAPIAFCWSLLIDYLVIPILACGHSIFWHVLNFFIDSTDSLTDPVNRPRRAFRRQNEQQRDAQYHLLRDEHDDLTRSSLAKFQNDATTIQRLNAEIQNLRATHTREMDDLTNTQKSNIQEKDQQISSRDDTISGLRAAAESDQAEYQRQNDFFDYYKRTLDEFQGGPLMSTTHRSFQSLHERAQTYYAERNDARKKLAEREAACNALQNENDVLRARLQDPNRHSNAQPDTAVMITEPARPTPASPPEGDHGATQPAGPRTEESSPESAVPAPQPVSEPAPQESQPSQPSESVESMEPPQTDPTWILDLSETQTIYNASFEHGHKLIQTSGEDLQCGFDALIQSYIAQVIMPVGKSKPLMKLEDLQDIFARQFPGESPRNIEDTHISRLLCVWAHQVGASFPVQLGIYCQDETRFIIREEDIPGAEYYFILWIHNDLAAMHGAQHNHWWGMKPATGFESDVQGLNISTQQPFEPAPKTGSKSETGSEKENTPASQTPRTSEPRSRASVKPATQAQTRPSTPVLQTTPPQPDNRQNGVRHSQPVPLSPPTPLQPPTSLPPSTPSPPARPSAAGTPPTPNIGRNYPVGHGPPSSTRGKGSVSARPTTSPNVPTTKQSESGSGPGSPMQVETEIPGSVPVSTVMKYGDTSCQRPHMTVPDNTTDPDRDIEMDDAQPQSLPAIPVGESTPPPPQDIQIDTPSPPGSQVRNIRDMSPTPGPRNASNRDSTASTSGTGQTPLNNPWGTYRDPTGPRVFDTSKSASTNVARNSDVSRGQPNLFSSSGTIPGLGLLTSPGFGTNSTSIQPSRFAIHPTPISQSAPLPQSTPVPQQVLSQQRPPSHSVFNPAGGYRDSPISPVTPAGSPSPKDDTQLSPSPYDPNSGRSQRYINASSPTPSRPTKVPAATPRDRYHNDGERVTGKEEKVGEIEVMEEDKIDYGDGSGDDDEDDGDNTMDTSETEVAIEETPSEAADNAARARRINPTEYEMASSITPPDTRTIPDPSGHFSNANPPHGPYISPILLNPIYGTSQTSSAPSRPVPDVSPVWTGPVTVGQGQVTGPASVERPDNSHADHTAASGASVDGGDGGGGGDSGDEGGDGNDHDDSSTDGEDGDDQMDEDELEQMRSERRFHKVAGLRRDIAAVKRYIKEREAASPRGQSGATIKKQLDVADEEHDWLRIRLDRITDRRRRRNDWEWLDPEQDEDEDQMARQAYNLIAARLTEEANRRLRAEREQRDADLEAVIKLEETHEDAGEAAKEAARRMIEQMVDDSEKEEEEEEEEEGEEEDEDV